MRSTTLQSFFVVTLLALGTGTTLGCSASSDALSSPSGSAAISGVVDGVSFAPIGAVDVGPTATSSSVSGDADAASATTSSSGAIIFLSEKANTCSAAHLASTNALQVFLFGDVAPGTYRVETSADALGASGTVAASLGSFDASCKEAAAPAAATSGTITITSVTATALEGSADLTFDGGKISGTFTAPICEGANAFAPAAGAGDTECAP